MRPKVHRTQLPMNGRNLSNKLLDLCFGNGACGEEDIELPFPRNEVGA